MLHRPYSVTCWCVEHGYIQGVQQRLPISHSSRQQSHGGHGHGGYGHGGYGRRGRMGMGTVVAAGAAGIVGGLVAGEVLEDVFGE